MRRPVDLPFELPATRRRKCHAHEPKPADLEPLPPGTWRQTCEELAALADEIEFCSVTISRSAEAGIQVEPETLVKYVHDHPQAQVEVRNHCMEEDCAVRHVVVTVSEVVRLYSLVSVDRFKRSRS